MRIENATYSQESAGRMVQWARNMRVHEGYWRTRHGIREYLLDAPEDFHSRSWQGGILYLPHDGQGVHYQGVGRDRIIASYSGRLYEIDPRTKRVTRIHGSSHDTGGSRFPVHLEQAENYVIRTDGVSRTLIHDGDSATFFSPGYNKQFPNASSVPNAAGPVRYLANRLWVSAYGRRLFAGDILHQLDPEEAIDVIRFRDQSYDATSQWFAPEAFQGDTVAVSRMKLGDREFVVMHGDNMGMTGIRLGIPRAQWGDTPMRLVISNETAAAGPYAFAEGDWRLLFRSRRGIEETRLVLAEDNTVGGTAIDLGKQVAKLLEADMEELLLFSTLVNPSRWERTFVTVSPRLKDGYAYHLGILSMNRNPGDAIEPGQWAWEGAWTLPERMGRIQQIIEGRVDSRQRVFGLVRKPNGNGLIEFRETEGLDELADGTRVRQNGAIRTHKLAVGSEYESRDFGELTFLIRDVFSDIDAEVYLRDSAAPDWRKFSDISVCLESCGDCDKCCGAGANDRGETLVPLGKLSGVSKDARWIQFHIETWGVASFDFVLQPGGSESIPEQRRERQTIPCRCEDADLGVFQYKER